MKKQRMTVHALTDRAWEVPGLSAQERLVLLHLIRISRNAECSIGLQDLADRFGLTQRQMTNVMATLVNQQLVERHPQISPTGGRLPNMYRIVATILMSIAALTAPVAPASAATATSENASYATLSKRRRRQPSKTVAA